MRITWLFNFYKGDKNPISNGKQCSGLKIGSFAKDYSLNLIKKKCRVLHVTFNDLIVTAISITLKKYFNENGDSKTNKLMLYIPFNIRMKLPSPDDRQLENKIAAHPYFLPLSLDFN